MCGNRVSAFKCCSASLGSGTARNLLSVAFSGSGFGNPAMATGWGDPSRETGTPPSKATNIIARKTQPLSNSLILNPYRRPLRGAQCPQRAKEFLNVGHFGHVVLG